MSGAAGHLPHLHENRELTFKELKEVLTKAAQGTLEEVTEKFDGMNLVFTWKPEINNIVVARSGSDIESGGMPAHELARRFQGRGTIEAAFNQAFQVLRQAINSLSPQELETIFGTPDEAVAALWYSIEVIYPSGINTINYDSNCIVFHRSPVFWEHGAFVQPVKTSRGVDLLASKIEQMQQAVTMRGWRVMGPNVVKLQHLSDGTALQRALSRIDDALSEAMCTDEDTIEHYLRSMAYERARAMGISLTVATQLARRLTNDPSAPSVTKLVAMSPRDESKIRSLVSRDKELQAEFMQPIQLAISELACEVLRGMNSILIQEPTKEIKRLQQAVGDAIDQVRERGDVSSIDKLERHVTMLQSLNNISSTMEGIVFIYRGRAYKMTGAWAPAHQILSLYKRTQGAS